MFVAKFQICQMKFAQTRTDYPSGKFQENAIVGSEDN